MLNKIDVFKGPPSTSNNQRMRILFFDTETNGLPTDRYALTTDVEKWPRIIQIAWQLWEFDSAESSGTRLCAESHIIRPPEDLVWNTESEGIHKISKARALSDGVPGDRVLAAFRTAASQAHVLSAHNMAFDKPVLRATYYRADPAERFSWWPSVDYCSMENTKMMCKLPSKYAKPHDPYKNPRLAELYKHLYGSEANVEFHSAAGDVECLVLCFLELWRLRRVPVDVWLRNFRVPRALATPKA